MLSPSAEKFSNIARKSTEEYACGFLLETLESRIAPAIINAGGLDASTAAPGSANFTLAQSPIGSTPFVLASASTDAEIATLFAGSDSNYYLQLNSKDVLNLFNGGDGYSPWISVTAGRALAFFDDANDNGIVESNEFTGLSLSKDASIAISSVGAINGDVLVNLGVSTGAGDTGFDANDLVTDGAIKALTVYGNVNGSIVAGGAITGVKIGGSVGSIGNGSFTTGYAYNLGGASGFGTDTLNPYILAVKKAGASISNISVGDADVIAASDGGAGGLGGSISNVSIVSDSDGVLIEAGDGGTGILSSTSGGAGGKISNVVIYGIQDGIADETIAIHGGNGGDGFGTGKSGAGGAVDKIYVGYQYQGKGLIKSTNFLNDFVDVAGGDGGDGASGGAGAALTNINIRVATPNNNAGADINLHGGDGGMATAANGKSGNGGGVSNYFVLNNYDGAGDQLAETAISGGDGGDGGSGGGIGGSVSTGVILSRVITVAGGDGGDGDKTGANGGSISDLNIAFPGDPRLTQSGQAETNLGEVYAQQVSLMGGLGGDALVSGNGGIGGSILKVVARQTDLSALSILGGAGGAGLVGAGGKGGIINDVHFDSDIDSANEVDAMITAGAGGDGDRNGGIGGDILGSSFQLTDASISVTAGAGGNASLGAGGNAGALKTLSAVVSGFFSGDQGTATLAAGNGGDGGTTGNGGNGGVVTDVTAMAWGDVSITSGTGGATTAGTAGNGGAISKATASAFDPTYVYTATTTFLDGDEISFTDNPADFGSASIIAGDGGAIAMTAKKGGNGGLIDASTVAGLNNILLEAGSGTGGGIGGDVKNSEAIGQRVASVFARVDTYSFGPLVETNLVDAILRVPFGTVTVTAGDGADGIGATGAGGKGGSLLNLRTDTGYYGDGIYTAGDGGDGAGNGGAGGAVTTLRILEGGDGQEAFIFAGDGGDSSVKGSGGVGGSVTGVSVLPDIVLRTLAAGDGGSSVASKGGVGGSISKVDATGDIGVRYGANYGFDAGSDGLMGGVFAGVGGAGVTAGMNGSVTDITATAIAAIVAGRDDSPQLVAKVSGINLKLNEEVLADFPGLNHPLELTAQGDGSFSLFSAPAGHTSTNINDANFIGGISGDPTVDDADHFKYVGGSFTDPVSTWTPGTVPLDGLVAALVFVNNGNIAYNALLQPATGGGLQLVSHFNT